MPTAIEFSKKVERFSQKLEPAAFHLTRDMEDAKDLLQETVMKAITNHDKFREGTNLKAWLFTIMKNIFINNYRRKKKKNTIIDSTDNLYYINSSAHDLPNYGEMMLNMQDLNNAVNQLTPDYKKPFMMHFEGYKYEEIAEEMEVPIGTIKSRIHLARKRLKKIIYQFNLKAQKKDKED